MKNKNIIYDWIYFKLLDLLKSNKIEENHILDFKFDIIRLGDYIIFNNLSIKEMIEYITNTFNYKYIVNNWR